MEITNTASWSAGGGLYVYFFPCWVRNLLANAWLLLAVAGLKWMVYTVQDSVKVNYSVSQKFPSPEIFWHFPQTFWNFSTKFYIPVTRSYLRSTTNIYSVICNFDKVMPY